MKAALTLDDLPHWNEYAYPPGHGARPVVDALSEQFGRREIVGRI